MLRWLPIVILLPMIVAGGCKTSKPPEIDLRAVYDRTDRDFESGVLFRPGEATAEDPAHLFAPLLIVENGDPGSTPPEVTYERTADGWVYRWTDPVSGIAQGIHATLGDDGFAIAYEVLHDSSGARLLFVDAMLEQRAAERFGPALPGRRFALERGLDETPDVAVGAIYEPGAIPLGPFVYLWNDTSDVNVVLCRCMAPRVFDIVDSIAYSLTPAEASDWRAVPLADSLRLP
jgi:hypothetical protein